MAEPKLKYTINSQIEHLPRTITMGMLEQILVNEHGISRETFWRDRNVTTDNDFSIPSDRLEVYAGLFGVTTDELKNYPKKKIKALKDRKLVK